MQALLWAGIHAFPAADALRGAGNLLEGQGHRAGLFAGLAGGAPLLFPVNLYQAEPVEPAVDGPQRAQVLAERTVGLDRQQDDSQQNPQLPQEQPARLAAQGAVGAEQGDGSQQGSGGTQKFAKRRDLGKSAPQKHGAGKHQQNQHRVLSIFQDVVVGQALSFFEDGDFVQEVLYQPEGAQPAADKAPQQAAEEEEEAQGRERDVKAPLIQQRLERPDGAGADGTGAGVAVQPRDTGVFQTATVDLPVEKAIQIAVCYNGKQQLHRQSNSIHRSPNPDALQADHDRLSPNHLKLSLKGSNPKENPSGQGAQHPVFTVLPKAHG